MQECSVHSLHMSSIPMGAMSELETCFSQCNQTSFVTVDDLLPCTLAHTSSIPMDAINFYMQERFLHSLIR